MKRSAFFRLQLFRLFGVPALGATVASVLVVLTQHIIQGAHSPGILAIGRMSLHFVTPVIFFVLFGVPAVLALYWLWTLRGQARSLGMTWYDYFCTPPEERASMRRSRGGHA